jgi:hypothetical protein
MTKSQIVSHFCSKIPGVQKTASGIIDEVAALAVSETKKNGSFTLPGIGKLVLVSCPRNKWLNSELVPRSRGLVRCACQNRHWSL